jgi:hypothetical protein
MLEIIYDQSSQSQKLHNILEHVTPYPTRKVGQSKKSAKVKVKV